MRINVYGADLTGTHEVVEKETATGTYVGIQMHIRDQRQTYDPQHDDRSAITFWMPSGYTSRIEMARQFGAISQIILESAAPELPGLKRDDFPARLRDALKQDDAAANTVNIEVEFCDKHERHYSRDTPCLLCDQVARQEVEQARGRIAAREAERRPLTSKGEFMARMAGLEAVQSYHEITPGADREKVLHHPACQCSLCRVHRKP